MVVPEQAGLQAASIAPLLRPDVMESSMRPVGAAGTPQARERVADLLARERWRPGPERVLFAGNGRQAISAAMAALASPGSRIGVEELTYPVVKAIATRLGITLVPLPVDGDGLIPQAVEAAMRRTPLDGLYLQPTLHNPLSLTMPVERRAELADVMERLDLLAIEDAIWSFLRHDLPPLATFAPERTILVDSLSKRLAPGLTLGFAVVPEALGANVSTALRSGGWTPMRFALDAATRWIGDGVAGTVARAKLGAAEARQALVARHLGEFAVRGDPRSFSCWWELPPPWRADTFVAAAGREGIAVTPAAAFAVGRRRAPTRSASAWPPRPQKPSPAPWPRWRPWPARPPTT